MGKNAYDKSNRQKMKTLDNLDRQGTSYRRIQELRNVWQKHRSSWLKMKQPPEFIVVVYIYNDDNDEEIGHIGFRTTKRGDGQYLIECEEFSWVD